MLVILLLCSVIHCKLEVAKSTNLLHACMFTLLSLHIEHVISFFISYPWCRLQCHPWCVNASRDKISSRTFPCPRHRHRILAVATPTVDARYFVAIPFV